LRQHTSRIILLKISTIVATHRKVTFFKLEQGKCN
jgi:hypothetical protein